MTTPRSVRTRSRRQRGAVLVTVGVALLTFLAMAAVGVDLAHLAFTATEVQSVAEVAATAGAEALINGGNVVAEAQTVAARNMVDGRPAAIAAGNIEVGAYAPATRTFTAGGTPANAVRATPSATVQNLLAGIFGDFTSTVQKSAIAASGALGSGQPTLPLALGECPFSQDSCLDQSCLPKFITVKDTLDTGAWTTFLSTGNGAAKDFLAKPCGTGKETAPVIGVGDSISLNGGTTDIFQVVNCLFNLGIREFLVPVVGVSCPGKFNQSAPVVGFATIVIDAVTATRKTKSIELHPVIRTDVLGPPGGCAGCGTWSAARLVS
ncbi:MAG: hypothetical protein E6J69_02245 [Deltaproteobacteria bacterium]|nr:MAG: hypothetical protein E6J69_02245 [Deltaproteobacteria bacterium]